MRARPGTSRGGFAYPWAGARPWAIAWATGEESEPSSANPSGTAMPGWAIIRGAVPRCGQVAVCTMNGWHR
jgi:hypothetical protein